MTESHKSAFIWKSLEFKFLTFSNWSTCAYKLMRISHSASWTKDKEDEGETTSYRFGGKMMVHHIQLEFGAQVRRGKGGRLAAIRVRDVQSITEEWYIWLWNPWWKGTIGNIIISAVFDVLIACVLLCCAKVIFEVDCIFKEKFFPQ